MAAEAPNTDPPRGAVFGASLLNKFPAVAEEAAAGASRFAPRAPVAGLVADSLPKETLGCAEVGKMEEGAFESAADGKIEGAPLSACFAVSSEALFEAPARLTLILGLGFSC